MISSKKYCSWERNNYTFSTHVSYNRAVVFWKVEKAPIYEMPPNSFLESPKFMFADAVWLFKMIPDERRGSDKEGKLRIYLKRHASSIPIHLIKRKFYFKDKTNKEHYSSEVEKEFNEVLHCLEIRTLERQNFVEVLEYLTENGFLTICCEITLNRVVKENNGLGRKQVTKVNLDLENEPPGMPSLCHDFRRLFENHRLSDIKLVVGGVTELLAHRAVLGARSSVFAAMLESDMLENHVNIIEITDIKPSIMKQTLHYMYTGVIQDQPIPQLIDLYVAADKYDLGDLKWRCSRIILSALSANEICDVAVLADQYEDNDLYKAVKTVLARDLAKVMITDRWKAFASDHPALYSKLLESILLDNTKAFATPSPVDFKL